MDRFMYAIPGKDNYRGHMHDNSFDLLKYRFDRLNTTMNSAYYHRFYKFFPKGAKGLEIQHRGFADKNLWVATTTQDKVAKVDTKDCYYDTNLLKTVCHRYESQFTYILFPWKSFGRRRYLNGIPTISIFMTYDMPMTFAKTVEPVNLIKFMLFLFFFLFI